MREIIKISSSLPTSDIDKDRTHHQDYHVHSDDQPQGFLGDVQGQVQQLGRYLDPGEPRHGDPYYGGYSHGSTMNIIEDLNRFTRQKPAGTFDPIFARTKLHCILCARGSSCLGMACLGLDKSRPMQDHRSSKCVPSPDGYCPGLVGDTKLTSLVEIKLGGSDERKSQNESALSCFGSLFGWKKKSSKSSSAIFVSSKPASPTPPTSPDRPCPRKMNPKPTKTSNHCSTDSYSVKALHALLRNSGCKTNNKKKRAKALVEKQSPEHKVDNLDIVIVAGVQQEQGDCQEVVLPFSNTVSNARPQLRSVPPSLSSSSRQQLYETCSRERIPEIEVLRSSPPPPIRPLSPEPLVRTSSKGHTPRKDTPKKNKNQRLQCRNQGCRVWFTSTFARQRHETQSCSSLPHLLSDISFENDTEYLVPSHDDLGLDPLTCRFPGCSKVYNQEKSRKRHEQEKHRLFEKRGRTVSPVSFPSQNCSESFLRPQSCPPPCSESTFLTPDRPRKRLRPSLPESPISPIASPTVSLTPNSSDISSTESDSSQDNTDVNECSSCLTIFQHRRDLKRHNCRFLYNDIYCKQHGIVPVILNLPPNSKETGDILSQLCQEDIVRLCTLQGWCLPSIYPFCFLQQHRSGRHGTVPLLESLTASNESVQLLKKMIKISTEVKLPKNIILKDRSRNVTAFLDSSILTPPHEHFDVTETSEFFFVRKATTDMDDETDMYANDIFEKDLDDDYDAPDVVYACSRPFSPHQDMEDCDLPSPLYTAQYVFQDSDLSESLRHGDGGSGDTVTGSAHHDTSEYDAEGDDNGIVYDALGRQGGGGGDDDGDDSDNSDGDNGDENDSRNRDNDSGDDTHTDDDPDFPPGIDGMGSRSIEQRQAASYFRKPWLFPDDSIQAMTRHSKRQFFNLVQSCRGAHARSSKLNEYAECLLLLLKLCHQLPFHVITVLFALPSKGSASEVFYRQLSHQYRTNSNIPAIIQNGVTNEEEVAKLLHYSYERTPQFHRTLLQDFEDPSGRGRIPVGLNIDATYFDIESSDDIEFQKHMYYGPRAGHTVKVLNITDLSGKFVGLLPVASSQSPSSGDGLLISKHIDLQDSSDSGKYVRSILRGNDRYFVIFITDAGFVVNVPNRPAQAQGSSLAVVCVEEHAVLLHTSASHERFHLEKTPAGSIRKVAWTAGNATLDENVVKFVRLFRKTQEQSHAGLKGMFNLFNMRNLWNSVLLPFTHHQLRRYSLSPALFKDMPKLNFIVTVCCSISNNVHPGFLPLSMDQVEQSRRASSLLTRLFLENPLLYPDIWPVNLTAGRRDTAWTEASFRDLETNDIIGFPKLNSDSINPTALDLVSGPHALQKADSVLTYMHQLLIKDSNLTREQASAVLQNFPSDWKVQYLDLTTPPDFEPSERMPRYSPSWWNVEQFGEWHDMRIVRCHTPPSYKTATTRSNFHWTVICFGRNPSARLGLLSPYDLIYCWRCFKCPSLNGSMSMDRHCAALLKALSFPHEFHSTAKPVNILNTVAVSRRQTTDILPPSLSADIPSGIQDPRRSRNTRLSGRANPLYNLNLPSNDNENASAIDPNNDNVDIAHISPPPLSTQQLILSPSNNQHSCGTPTRSGLGSSAQPGTAQTQPCSVPSPVTQTQQITVGNRSQEDDTVSGLASSTVHEPDNYSSHTVPVHEPSQSHRESVRSRLFDRSERSGRTSRATQLDPGSQVSRHIDHLDPHHVYSIPGPSQSQLSSDFNINHLQPGLLNDGNVCGLISILLCFHRLRIFNHLLDPHFCYTPIHTPDYPSLILHKILDAMPSTHAFSIQLLIMSWNRSGRQPNIQPGTNDLLSLAEALVTNMHVKQYSSRPVFTQFLASFRCSGCGKNHTRVNKWDGQPCAAIPMLQLPSSDHQTGNIPALLASYLEEPLHTTCSDQQCRQRIFNGQFETDTGHYTVLAVNRFDDGNLNRKRMNRLDLSFNEPNMTGHDIMGELVSCVCHRGDINHGHFVSYHRVGALWFLNDDSRACVVSEDPFVQTRFQDQTIDLLFFANNI